jgi:hypothetical protein
MNIDIASDGIELRLVDHREPTIAQCRCSWQSLVKVDAGTTTTYIRVDLEFRTD